MKMYQLSTAALLAFGLAAGISACSSDKEKPDDGSAPATAGSGMSSSTSPGPVESTAASTDTANQGTPTDMAAATPSSDGGASGSEFAQMETQNTTGDQSADYEKSQRK